MFYAYCFFDGFDSDATLLVRATQKELQAAIWLRSGDESIDMSAFKKVPAEGLDIMVAPERLLERVCCSSEVCCCLESQAPREAE